MISLLKDLLKDLLDNERRRLMHFSLSAVVFFIGYWMLYWSDDQLPPSLEQELIALALLLTTAGAFFWAILMQVLFIVSRIINK